MALNYFTENESQEWKDILLSFPEAQQDIYYSPEYYQSWKKHEKAQIQCLHYKNNGIEILYPYFRKEINGYKNGKDYSDVFNAYGYGGILINQPDSCPPAILKDFNKKVDEYFADTKVLSEFIRENPLIRNSNRDALRQIVRKNIYIDTSTEYILPCKNVRENYHKALNKELHIEIDEDCNMMDEFVRLYRITAARLDMNHYYRFEDEYFSKLKHHLNNHIKLLYVRKDGKIIAGMILIYYNKRAVIHLSASDFRYQTCRLNDFLFVSGIREAVRMKMDNINLGGGTRNEDHDGLYRFKRKFGKDIKEVYVGKKVYHEDVYKAICNEWEEKYPQLTKQYSHYLQKHLITSHHE